MPARPLPDRAGAVRGDADCDRNAGADPADHHFGPIETVELGGGACCSVLYIYFVTID